MSACKFPHCEEIASKERKSIFCEEHFGDWMRSTEWRQATQDETVRFWMGLGIQKEAMKVVNKYGRKWAKRVSDEQLRAMENIEETP